MKIFLNNIVCSSVLFRLSLVACYFLLSACGFHLRGPVVLPEQMLKTHVIGVSEAEPLYQEIRFALDAAGGTLVKREAASAILKISSARFNRRVLSVGSSGLASEYELNFLLKFSLQEAIHDSSLQDEQLVLVPTQKVSISRAYSFDSSNVLGKSAEEDLLREEILQVAVKQMVRQLRSSLYSSSLTDSSITAKP
ncbi:MAG: hypothetical protein KAJ19_01920 [Gammaproteobacteria bacterium]|nr:hypothetical protein [Gammaproteobacteria bacterium]